MNQKINLLNDLPKWEKAQYPLNFVIGLNIVLILLLMAFYTLFHFEFRTKERIVNGMLYQFQKATAQLGSLQKRVIASSEDEKSSAEYQTYLYDLFENNADNGTSGFYNALETLGSQINNGVWLNQIDFKNFGSQVSLTGFSIQPQNAMTYVASLNSHPVFKDKLMKLENIRNLTQKNYLFIKIASQTKKV